GPWKSLEGAPSSLLHPAAVTSAASNGLLERASGRELRHPCCRDLDLLARVAGVHALARRPVLGRELAEPGEGNLFSVLQRICDRVDHRVHCLRCFAATEATLLRDSLNEFLLGHVLSSPAALTGLGPRQTLPG